MDGAEFVDHKFKKRRKILLRTSILGVYIKEKENRKSDTSVYLERNSPSSSND